MKMWDGRFSKPTDDIMNSFNRSLNIDEVLIEDDIAVNIAWAESIHEAGIIDSKEKNTIQKELENILNDYNNGSIEFKDEDEDIHMAIERLLTERTGEAGAKLHTGRSRNDQVACDFRLFTRKKNLETAGQVKELQRSLLKRAEKDFGIIMPGYTHLQQAQPLLISHYWLSFLFLLERERTRLLNAAETCDLLVLGSGAIAGSGFNIDRKKLAERLGFSKISQNSIDGVSSRDFVLESLFSISSLGISLSRYAEDLIIWSSLEFGFIELDDSWSTGSSMMPQKKNPDSLELIRSKAGRFISNLMNLSVSLKGVGLAYYKDLQEDKEPLINSVMQISQVLAVFSGVIESLTVKKDVIESRLNPFLLATDIADYLSRNGIPFRKAHQITGQIVAWCMEKKNKFNELNLDDLQHFSPVFKEDVLKIFNWETALQSRNIEGGTSHQEVKKQLARAKNLVKN